jgi:hypothetical protein
MTKWNSLPEPLQAQLTTTALAHLGPKLAALAETLAADVSAQSGQEALRQLAEIVRGLRCSDLPDVCDFEVESTLPKNAIVH